VDHTILIAVGGNSLIRAGERGMIPEQAANARVICERIAELAARGYRIVVTHGNGPQVGSQLLRSEAGSAQTYTLPLDVCVAMTQGEIGYILQTTLQTVLAERGIEAPVATLLSLVLVDKDDPAFQRPTKPIGPVYREAEARAKAETLGWSVVDDAARGYRRVVASPKPAGIVGLAAIQHCLAHGIIVITAGGGGIPVVDDNGALRGVEAVIDKDRASMLLASRLGIERMVISTDVDRVYLNYNSAHRFAIAVADLTMARGYLAEGHFAEGSMKPKIEAAIAFVEHGGTEAIITDPAHLIESLEGHSGTHIIREHTHEPAPHR
jgi:carbamate kinase